MIHQKQRTSNHDLIMNPDGDVHWIHWQGTRLFDELLDVITEPHGGFPKWGYPQIIQKS